jgi:hypothetical protein
MHPVAGLPLGRRTNQQGRRAKGRHTDATLAGPSGCPSAVVTNLKPDAGHHKPPARTRLILAAE